MSPWAIVAAVYGAVLGGAALVLPVRRRFLAASACVAYVWLAIGLGTLPQQLWITLLAPAALLLLGYWLSALLFREAQPSLEAWLLASDRRLFRALAIDSILERAPHWMLELLEAAYLSIYAVITL